jgi:cystathionine gamma-synthase
MNPVGSKISPTVSHPTQQLETRLVHAGSAVDATGAVAPPIHMSTTFVHPADSALLDGYLYQRYSNPTQEQLEVALAELDGASRALFFATGLAAAAAMLHTLKPGSRVLLADDTYFAIRKLFLDEGERIGMRCELIDMTDLQSVARALASPADMVWLESPSNPLIKITDIESVARLAKAAGATVVVDATFCTPLLLRPLSLGADVVLHSTTKYLSGHSDNMGGSLTLNHEPLYLRLFELRKLLGGTASPFAAWLTLRGIRSLGARLAWMCASAKQVAAFLSTHPNVVKVHYPGLATHPNHAVAARQMKDFGAMLSFETKGSRADSIAAAARLRVFTNATSLGSVESLVEHRQSVEGKTSTTPDTLLRLSIGLEHADDLIADLRQALG